MPNQAKKTEEELGIKIGSDEMVYWKTIIDRQKLELDNLEKSLKFSNWLVDNATKEYEKAEKEFNSK